MKQKHPAFCWMFSYALHLGYKFLKIEVRGIEIC